jgi:hypothetical protein
MRGKCRIIFFNDLTEQQLPVKIESKAALDTLFDDIKS